MTVEPRIVDAHLHLWDRRASKYDWITPELGILDDDFRAADAHAELVTAGVDSAILVQADDTESDTRFLLDTARENTWVAAVVGWIPLDRPAAAAAALDALADEPALRGIRHLVHNDPRDGFLSLPAVRSSLRVVADRGLAFDVPDSWPRFLAPATDLARALPELTVVIDHLGKPPVGGDDFGAWRSAFEECATVPNTVAKFSGLHRNGEAHDRTAMRVLWRIALDAFGPHRLMYGSDWPMSIPGGGYQPNWSMTRECLDDLTADERAAVLGGTAERVYSTALYDSTRPEED